MNTVNCHNVKFITANTQAHTWTRFYCDTFLRKKLTSHKFREIVKSVASISQDESRQLKAVPLLLENSIPGMGWDLRDGVPKSFRTGSLEWELQMVQVSLGAIVSLYCESV
jgi:hypothetical protein